MTDRFAWNGRVPIGLHIGPLLAIPCTPLFGWLQGGGLVFAGVLSAILVGFWVVIFVRLTRQYRGASARLTEDWKLVLDNAEGAGPQVYEITTYAAWEVLGAGFGRQEWRFVTGRGAQIRQWMPALSPADTKTLAHLLAQRPRRVGAPTDSPD